MSIALALQVTAAGARNWVLRISVTGKQCEMGLGSFPSVPLAEAREKARAYQAKVEQGEVSILARQTPGNAAAVERSFQQSFSSLGVCAAEPGSS